MRERGGGCPYPLYDNWYDLRLDDDYDEDHPDHLRFLASEENLKGISGHHLALIWEFHLIDILEATERDPPPKINPAPVRLRPHYAFSVNISTRGTVTESQVASIADADLKRLGISRPDLERVFAEAKELMKERGLEPGDRIGPVAERSPNGTWHVVLVKR